MKFKENILSAVAVALLSVSAATAAIAANEAPAVVTDNADAPAAQNGTPRIATNVTGSYLSGQFARSRGNVDEAISYLRRVHREQPDDAATTVQLQGMLLMQGQFDEAAVLAEDIRNSDANDPLSDLLLVIRDIRGEKYDAAAEILSSEPEEANPQLWKPLLLGWVDVSRKKLSKPLMVNTFGTDIGRAAPLVNYHMALINAQAGFKEEAAKNFRDAIEDPVDPPIRIMKMLAKFYDQNDEPEILTPIVKTFRGAHPEFSTEASMPVIATPTDGIAEVLYTMGGIMFGAGVVNDAAIYLQLAVYIKPDLSEAIMALGDSYTEMQQYNRANEVYAKIVSQDPLYIKAQLHIAVNQDHMGKFKEALSLLDKMVKQSTTDVDALITKGDLLRIHSRYGEAVDAYTQALKRMPDIKSSYWPVLFARGSCLEREGKWAEAEKDLQHALELKPDQPDVLNYLGFSQLEHGENIDAAREMIAKAVKARPNDAQILDSMGWVLYLKGDYENARDYMEKAVELLPGDPTVNDHLGDVYWRLGRKNEARFQWERSLSFSPEIKLADSIHKKLKDGPPPPNTMANSTPSDTDGKPVLAATP